MASDKRQATSWTTSEVRLLRRFAHLGAEECASQLGRSVSSVRCAASRYRVSLRRPGSRRGLVLGQPRGARIDPEARILLVTGVVSSEEIDRRLRAVASGDLCPRCGRRPIEVRVTGWCRDCHLRELAWAHRQAVQQLPLRREVVSARQAKSRATRRA